MRAVEITPATSLNAGEEVKVLVPYAQWETIWPALEGEDKTRTIEDCLGCEL